MQDRAMEEVNPSLNSATGGIMYSAAVIFYFAASLLAGIIIVAAGVAEGSNAYVYISYLASPIALGASVFAVLKARKVRLREVFPVKCKPKYYLIALLLVFGLLFALSWVNTVAVEFFKLFGYVQRESTSYFPDLTGARIIPALIVIAVLPALFEELLFRGVILNNLERSAGSVRAVLIAGFCFSLFHASPEQTVYQFIAGCAFALLAVRSRSIMPSVMMHFINNALIVILQACNAFGESGELLISSTANIIITAFAAAALIGAIVWLILDKTPLKKCAKGGVSAFFICASVGIAILGITWILALFGVG